VNVFLYDGGIHQIYTLLNKLQQPLAGNTAHLPFAGTSSTGLIAILSGSLSYINNTETLKEQTIKIPRSKSIFLYYHCASLLGISISKLRWYYPIKALILHRNFFYGLTAPVFNSFPHKGHGKIHK
jgi:hypothetical protein